MLGTHQIGGLIGVQAQVLFGKTEHMLDCESPQVHPA
jgi:hypothetical protein